MCSLMWNQKWLVMVGSAVDTMVMFRAATKTQTHKQVMITMIWRRVSLVGFDDATFGAVERGFRACISDDGLARWPTDWYETR